MPETHTITRLGHAGDGIADTAGGPVIVPLALPGEAVRPRTDGGAPEIVLASSQRQTPVCRHFGVCGGCVAQHMAPALYAQWKRDLVVTALSQQQIEADVAPLRTIPPASRRRATLTARRSGGGITLGYHIAGSHDLVAISDCAVLRPGIVRRLEGLRALAQILSPARDDLRLSLLDDDGRGLDVAVEGGKASLSPAERGQIAEIAGAHGFLRVVVAGAEVVRHATPRIACSGVEVTPPPGGFLQATAESEAAMVAIIATATAKARHVADLFAGVGTFTLPIARHAAVTAVDSDKAALAALDLAARHAQGLRPITTRVRDLMREPLSPKELEPFDAVILDPPRAGAKGQAERLARSKVALVIAVSCNPATAARDLRTLLDGGYGLESITPIDQFLWSAHVEVVAVLRRKTRR